MLGLSRQDIATLESYGMTEMVSPLVLASMSENRFHQIKKHLRFDDKLRRIRDDPLAPVRDIVNQFNVDVNKVYRPGPFICVDEMLLEFHGRV